MISTSDFKIGLTIELNREVFTIIDFQHVKPGKGGAFVRTKLKNRKTYNTIEKTFRTGEKIKKAHIEKKKMQYLYKEKNEYFFMDVENYEQLSISLNELKEKNSYYLKENMEIDIVYYGNEIIDIELPINFVFKVIETDPEIKGNTASNTNKNAIIETGAKIKVPLFINKGDELIIDTRTGEYISRK